MRILDKLDPERFFYHFEELTKIPHGSYNVDAISDYLASFGKNHGLETYQDEFKNVIIIKEASQGYENEPPIIIQGHMDMVAVHKPELDVDMKTEPLKVRVNEAEDYIYAEGTSLGGDDGFAVAAALTLLEDESLKHPRLEVVITTNEETGMEGARGIDLSMLKGTRLLNLDSEDEGIFLTSCAGGLRINADFPVRSISAPSDAYIYEIEIGGLLGGHSGEEIIKGRANSNKLAARMLKAIAGENKVYITSLKGGLADNAIPRVTTIKVVVTDPGSFEDKLRIFEEEVRNEFHKKDPGFTCRILSKKALSEPASGTGIPAIFDITDALDFLFTVPNGVQAMSADIEGLVETSLNLGIVELIDGSGNVTGRNVTNGNVTDGNVTDGNITNGYDVADDKAEASLHATFSVRSSIESAKKELTDRVLTLVKTYGGNAVITGDYPGWAYRSDSPLRDKMCALYEKMYGKKPILKAIHAGLECGLLNNKISGLDCVSIGPDMKDIHTTEEKLYISSSRRVYEFVRALLETKDL